MISNITIKPIQFLAVVLMCFVSLACAKPQDKASTTAKPYADVTASKSVKDAIAEAKKKKNCYAECDKLTEVYEPVCAHDPANPQTKPRTFGNECVMKAHNCEMGTSKFFIYEYHYYMQIGHLWNILKNNCWLYYSFNRGLFVILSMSLYRGIFKSEWRTLFKLILTSILFRSSSNQTFFIIHKSFESWCIYVKTTTFFKFFLILFYLNTFSQF